ncbi:hypothetical protein FOMG_19977 [Fusarium oxysporum f. sp. melonis 26406]|uniref:Uncharacterized protein n=1 Tax=Fusarium oxysporum f. sp. melonis 26406 TaxID=1089452 RepID=W9YUJ2_FUSOX|nr:hypothetical protein FOMG_19977 [Fusarium oxysporum f. sp. melonis 26406]
MPHTSFPTRVVVTFGRRSTLTFLVGKSSSGAPHAFLSPPNNEAQLAIVTAVTHRRLCVGPDADIDVPLFMQN